MIYSVITTELANDHIDKLVNYLVNRLNNPDAAIRFMDKLEKLYGRLAENPLQFPLSNDDFLQRIGYREALVSKMNYRVIFRIEMDIVYIVGVFHTSENFVRKLNLDD